MLAIAPQSGWGQSAPLASLEMPEPVQAPPVVPQDAFGRALHEAAADDSAVAAFHADLDHRPFWTAQDAVGEMRRGVLLSALDAAALHALPVGRYDAAGLRAAFADLRSEADRGRLEARMSKVLASYARDLNSGALNNLRSIDKDLVREIARPDPGAILAGFAADPESYLEGLAPRSPEYARLIRARLAMMDLVARGGWGGTVAGSRIKPGVSGPVVVQLRERLNAMGWLAEGGQGSYDAVVQQAVRDFQQAHGLTPDGVVGEATLKALNIPAEERLAALTVALERERWSNQPRGKRHIWVNLADFSAQIVDDDKVTFSTRAVIGGTRDDKRTPEFSHHMTYMEINPDWTVPPGIIRRDYLPRLQANRNALGHLQVVDSRGRVIPRDQIDFSRYSAGNFPYSLRQPPGPSNALGRVKFMFPNPWSIYLHDTPERGLFSRETRTFSSGCVRLNDPFDFAYALLAPQTDDPKKLFHRLLDSGKQQRLNLAQPVPVHLDYRTAFTDARGRVQFRTDVYGRDARIHEALLRAGVTDVMPTGLGG